MRRHTLVASVGLAVTLVATVSLYALLVDHDRGMRRAPDDRWLVHEWGTFTVLQDFTGRALPGVNVDDEPVPDFVHRHPPRLTGPAAPFSPFAQPVVGRAADLPFNPLGKGLPRIHPDVVMRLETPVIYFYPPRAVALPASVDVEVAMHGGWLTEFYPNAIADAPGIRRYDYEGDDGADYSYHTVGPLAPDAVGRLAWRNLRVGVTGDPVATDAPVWLAPRNVRSAMLETSDGQRERYVFYRGVANRPSPLRVTRSADGATLTAAADPRAMIGVDPSWSPAVVWLVDIRPDGTLAFAPAEKGVRNLFQMPASFDDAAYSVSNRDALRRSMHAALVADGLFADEATAMLDTWDASYFRAPGLRVFYLLPRSWTDAVMPLSVSVDADVRRTMVGRVELVTPRQHELLDAIAAGPATSSQWVYANLFAEGKPRYASMDELAGAPDLPADVAAYLALGRFRDALVLDRLRDKPTDALRQFTWSLAIHPFVAAPADIHAD